MTLIPTPRSPCLKLKPVSKGKKSGYLMANVEPYGGGLWHTWFDRDLTVAGRVIVRQGDKMLHRLVSSYPFRSGTQTFLLLHRSSCKLLGESAALPCR